APCGAPQREAARQVKSRALRDRVRGGRRSAPPPPRSRRARSWACGRVDALAAILGRCATTPPTTRAAAAFGNLFVLLESGEYALIERTRQWSSMPGERSSWTTTLRQLAPAWAVELDGAAANREHVEQIKAALSDPCEVCDRPDHQDPGLTLGHG